ncbi:hypothetical protein LCGC14_1014720 [marine sediment metagenome]|uniref:Uncharacterized protein n=1 Tax=marine sediment metagenome TaxID=412755 RepID=A0A0F9N3L5_9ZZZZ
MEKENRTIKEFKKREKIVGFFILFFILSFGVVVYAYDKLEKEQEMLKEGLRDFMIYMGNITNYCAELNNMTHEELLQSYLRYETDKILEDFRNNKGS